MAGESRARHGAVDRSSEDESLPVTLGALLT